MPQHFSKLDQPFAEYLAVQKLIEEMGAHKYLTEVQVQELRRESEALIKQRGLNLNNHIVSRDDRETILDIANNILDTLRSKVTSRRIHAFIDQGYEFHVKAIRPGTFGLNRD